MATCLSAGARVTGYSDGVFGRLLDLDGLFRELGPELEARLARSPFREWTGTVRLKTDIGTVKLPFNQGELQPAGTPRPERSAVMSQSWLARLITGYNDVAVVGRPRDTDVAERDWPLIRALFPKACPYIWAADGGY